MRKTSWWIAALLAGLVTGWQVPAWGNAVRVSLTVAEPELAMAVEPGTFTFSAISTPQVQTFTESFAIRNTGNVPFSQVRMAIDLAGLSTTGWRYVNHTGQPATGQFNVNAKTATQPDWLGVPTIAQGSTALPDSDLAPSETLPVDLRLRLGPNPPAGEGSFDILLEIVP